MCPAVLMRSESSVQWRVGPHAPVLDGLTEAEITYVTNLSTARPVPTLPHEREEHLRAWLKDVRTSPAAVRLLDATPTPLDQHPLSLAVAASLNRLCTRAGPELVVLTDSYVTDPLRTVSLMRSHTPHLPVVIGDGITVGPLVIPGLTPCTRCLDLARRDADSTWPLLAVQLAQLEAAVGAAHFALASSLAVVTVADQFNGRGWHAGSEGVGCFDLSIHPECGCATDSVTRD